MKISLHKKLLSPIFCLFHIGMLLLGTPFDSKGQQYAPICATPGADGPYNFPSPINTFFPGSNDNSIVSEGATQVSLDAVPDPFYAAGTAYNFGVNQIEKGSLLLIFG